MANRFGQPLPSGEKVPAAASTAPIPNLITVAEVAALADPVARNAQITRCYHELSALLAARTGRSANWCTFATWASKQAGQTISQEDLAAWLQDQLSLRALPLPALTELLTLVQLLGSSHPMLTLIKRDARLLITEHMMRIGLADGRFIRLGRDLPATFPPSLRQISLPENHL